MNLLEDWRNPDELSTSAHRAGFEIDKFALVQLARRREAAPIGAKTREIHRPALTLGDVVIQPSASTKLLGVHLGKGLGWAVRATAACAEGMKYMLTAKRLSVGKRVPGRLAEIWCSPIGEAKPGQARRGGPIGFAKKLAQVQRMANLFVTGAMGSTPAVALDAHAGFLPIELLTHRICYRAALRCATKPEGHPVHEIINFATRAALSLDPLRMEKIAIVRSNTYRKKAMTIRITPNKDKALSEEADDKASTKVYSDGSGLESRIGAVAVMFHTNDPEEPPEIPRNGG
ncbi:hypothetical protein FIBSPDRAFT_1046090 [Athelia psychrophila]|uniref:Uncharacterized protein n=1 Tax=Athelia psychrophila TaxID=1759441 RepID=A0A166H829_9AGAM|nr:hypothetical protein FIBSPDRAFT_1046090 [Fibularhizoctonia sp. CBS 109695]